MDAKLNRRVTGVVPARLASTRLPRKVLREIAGRPMLAWVVEAAINSRAFDSVIVAADSEEVAELCRGRNWEFRMTAPELASGTDRVGAVARQLAVDNSDASSSPKDIFVNIQGDEPLLRPEHFHALLRPFSQKEAAVCTVMTPCPADGIANPNVVKVVVNHNGEALYFSRAPIPWDRDQKGGVTYWKHLGLYAYTRRALYHFQALTQGRLEAAERLEQLRLLENGIAIHVEPVEFDTIGVDTEEDLATAATALSQRAS